MKSKKGAGVMDNIGGLGIAIMTLAIVLVVGFLIISQVQDNIVDVEGITVANTSTWTTAYNSTVTTAEAVEDIPGWIPVVVITAIGGLLLGMVTMMRKAGK